MSHLIRKMLADRARATRVHEAAKRRAAIGPIWRAFSAGFNLMRAERSKLDDKAAAFQEGCDTGLFDAGCDVDTAWRISDARKRALAKFGGGPT